MEAGESCRKAERQNERKNMRKNSIKNTRINMEVQRELSQIICLAGNATIEGLKSAEGYIRRELARRVNLRNTPEIKFILDQSIEYGVNMSKLIDEVTKDIKE